ncbi:Periodic tryptophan protein 2 like [Schistosoma japonicum]|nr:Periodic tryptophan protein 2 like [Schistosoma japonicum]
MRLNFKFKNLFGTAYKCGSIIFTDNGFGLLSPVGNQITVFDLKRDEVASLDISSFHDVRHLALSPLLPMLVAVNDGKKLLRLTNNLILKVGDASLCSLSTGAVISVYQFKGVIFAVSFSPDGKFLAVGKGHNILLFYAPSQNRQFNHLELYRIFYGFTDNIICIDWSSDSRFFIAGSVDSTSRLFSVYNIPKIFVYTLAGHKNPIMGAFILRNLVNILTVSSDGFICLWEAKVPLDQLRSIDDSTPTSLFRISNRYRYADSADVQVTSPVSAVAFHKDLRLLATGFESGLLLLHTFPDFIIVSEVNMFTNSINSLAINKNGDWIGAASELFGQIAVWEWRSQSYYMRADSHSKEMTSLAYSPDGLHLATGGYDNKVKVWRVSNGRSIVTFTEHTAGVTGVAFPAQNSKVVVSASLDGTVRAYDLIRYRNFRTFTVPTRRVQFSSLAVDTRGSLVAAGGLDTFEAYVWSVKTGQLLTILTGHTAPISALAFNPDISGIDIELATVSWDSTLRLWDVTGNSTDENNLSSMGLTKEVVNFSCDALCVAYRGDGKQLAISLLNGNIVFYDPNEGVEMGTIDGHRDLGISQTSADDLVTPRRAAEAKKFQTIAYSVDGEHLIAGGDSKYVCLYSVPDKLLMKRFEVTCNLSLGGVQELHDRRNYLSRFSMEALNAKESQRPSLPIPSTTKGEDRSRRQWKLEARVSGLGFSPTGDAFAATTTEGVLIYCLPSAGTGYGIGSTFGVSSCSDSGWLFDTLGIDEETTPSNARDALIQGRQAEALDMAIRLQLHELVEEIIESIPVDQTFLARQLSGRSRHVELYIRWTHSILRSHSLNLRRIAANSALSESANSKDSRNLMDKESLDDRKELSTPGFLTFHGEWAACQASLVRLQASLNHVKSHLIKQIAKILIKFITLLDSEIALLLCHDWLQSKNLLFYFSKYFPDSIYWFRDGRNVAKLWIIHGIISKVYQNFIRRERTMLRIKISSKIITASKYHILTIYFYIMKK